MFKLHRFFSLLFSSDLLFSFVSLLFPAVWKTLAVPNLHFWPIRQLKSCRKEFLTFVAFYKSLIFRTANSWTSQTNLKQIAILLKSYFSKLTWRTLAEALLPQACNIKSTRFWDLSWPNLVLTRFHQLKPFFSAHVCAMHFWHSDATSK